MIRKNSLSSDKQVPHCNSPFLLKPVGKDYLWGGTRLNDEFAKEISMDPLAETWECSTHDDGLSVIASGEYQGKTLKEVLRLHPDFIGSHPRIKGDIPILVKFIDAKNDLSVQVHPDDDYAFKHENGQLGKSEMWYILDADKDSKIVYGLHHNINKEQFREQLQLGTVEKYLLKVSVKQDDVFFIKAGTIHAIGAGVLVAEIQEKSNLTYRLYDYNRVDKHGQKRELHVSKALDVANLSVEKEPAQPMRVLRYEPGCAREMLCNCRYFWVERLLLNTERQRTMINYEADSVSFKILLCINGCGTIFWDDNNFISFFKGDCIFVPANSKLIHIHGKAQFLSVGC